ncbi:MAG: patatin-like phospholipase family protein [Candidatus Thorarchaeota archaeon]
MTDTEPRKLKKEEVKYLALEGGGGKGITYLGAIKALETLGILPINPESTNNVIKGVTGSSAGAITAFLLAMGLKSGEIEKVLNKMDFNSFLDDPRSGQTRAIFMNKKGWLEDDYLYLHPTNVRVGLQLCKKIMIGLGPIIEKGIDFLADKPEDIRNQPIYKKIFEGDKTPNYLFNLLYDRGLFPGLTVRNFFKAIIGERFSKRALKEYGILPVHQVLTFRNFKKWTGISLAITGTNVATGQPSLFSPENTPNFPVSEAVAISMNFPFVFKPIWVDEIGQAPNNPYQFIPTQGFYSDGGILNNIPIHAFDRDRKLNKNMLGLRLTSKPEEKQVDPKKQPNMVDYLRNPLLLVKEFLKNNILEYPNLPELTIFKFLGSFVETLFYPQEKGQIRSEQEDLQTVNLDTYKLTTLDFNPPPNIRKEAIENAETKVMDYFK